MRINLKPLQQLHEIPNSVFNQWAARYRAFAQERFVIQSRGGGEWPPLKYKRKRGSMKRAAILRDTGTLFAALDVHFQRNPGQYQKRIPMGITVGFGGPARHPKAPVSVADLAAIHHFGLGRVPARPIIVDPSDQVVEQMSSDIVRFWNEKAR